MVTLTENIASKKLKKLMKGVSESHHPVKIKGKNSSAVLISEEDWNAIEESLYLISIPGMRESIIKGLNTPVEKCTDKLNIFYEDFVLGKKMERAKKTKSHSLKTAAKKLKYVS